MAEAHLRELAVERIMNEARVSVEQQAWLAEPRHPAPRTEHDDAAAVNAVSEPSDIPERV